MTTAPRLRSALAVCAADNRAALVIYLTFADPDISTSIENIIAAANAGADVIEVGVPYSDPSADGPVIAAAMERALIAGGSLPSALDAVAAVRARGCHVPIVLFGYYNPIFVMGPEAFAKRAAAAGVDACLVVDLPLGEMAELSNPLQAEGLDLIPLLAPTSTPARISLVGGRRAPFVYYISMTGVTGAALDTNALSPDRIAKLKSAVHAPLMIGFGIKTAADVRAVAALADGVVVGSALVSRIANAGWQSPAAVTEFVAELATALAR